jgi:anti-sigma B factor antagonist
MLEDVGGFEMDHSVTDDIVVMTIRGPMDVATVPRLRDTLIRLIDEGHERFVFEMSEVDFIDSIGLGVIVGVVHRLRPHDGSLALAAPSAHARKVFRITQLARVLSLHDTLDEALAAVREGAAVLSTTRPITRRSRPES